MASSYTCLQLLPALNQGGVERGSVEMARFLAAQGHSAWVASAGGRMVADVEKAGARHFTLPLANKNPLSGLCALIQLICFLRREKVDVVHARSRWPAWIGFFACKLTGTPFITTFHGTHSTRGLFKKGYNRVMLKGRYTIAISQFIRQHLHDVYHADMARIFVAPRGVDMDYFNPDHVNSTDITAYKHAHGLKEGVPIILLPGRISPWKGHDTFLEALALIKDVPCQGLIVGDAGKKIALFDALQAKANDLGLGDKIVFAPGSTNMPLIYSVADVVVSAANEPEAFGRVAIEAQAMKKCVIATAHGGSLETVIDGETGYLIPPHDAKSMAKMIRKVCLDGSNVTDMGDKGRRHVHNSYTMQRMCENEFDVYKKVLESA